MKRYILGIVLFLAGFMGTLAMLSFAILNPIIVDGVDSLWMYLKGNNVLLPFICYLIMGISGIGICIHEAYYKDFIRRK